jgi:glutamate N-acetyltransferase/amino-acid N-acetyltransferase
VSVTAAGGFRAAGVAAGIKASGDLDLALIDAGRPVAAAAVFTRNRVQAAPVRYSRAVLAAAPLARGVILNSGNANAATGPAGDECAARMARVAGDGPFLVCSTGLIGIPLDPAVVERAAPDLRSRLAATPAAGLEAATAIMTTDTVAKQSRREAGGVVVGGMAKGAAMLHPDMATMLAVLTTDWAAEPAALQAALGAAVDASFNRISVDGAMSTNDTVILLASGAAGPGREADVAAAVAAVCSDLAEQMVRDAEGATRCARVRVVEARNEAEALAVARKIVRSDLVRCSLYGGDPYWGRVIAEAGASGVPIDPDRIAISYGGIVVCRQGRAADHDEAAALAAAGAADVEITVHLGMGAAAAEMLTADLTHGYIDENKGTS